MKKGKFQNGQRAAGGKVLAAMLAVLLLIGGTVGGTLAWLTASTEEVENTFTVGNIDITLAETKQEYKMVPGNTIDKDPKVTVEKGSEACWVFVDVNESANLKQYIIYDIADGWTLLETDSTGQDIKGQLIYYRHQADLTEATDDAVYSVIGNKGFEGSSTFTPDQVLVKTSVTKEMMDKIEKGEESKPTLTFKAYAIQSANIGSGTDAQKAAAAWAEVSK